MTLDGENTLSLSRLKVLEILNSRGPKYLFIESSTIVKQQLGTKIGFEIFIGFTKQIIHENSKPQFMYKVLPSSVMQSADAI